MCIFNISFAYLFWLAKYKNKHKQTNKKQKQITNKNKDNKQQTNKQTKPFPEFYMGFSDETWYMGSGGHK